VEVGNIARWYTVNENGRQQCLPFLFVDYVRGPTATADRIVVLIGWRLHGLMARLLQGLGQGYAGIGGFGEITGA
jgi:hypothetical protein